MGIELLAAATSGGAICLFALLLIRARQLDPAARRVTTLAERPSSGQGLSWSEVRRRGPSGVPFLANLLTDSAWAKRTELEIEQAGLKLRVGEYLVARIAAFVVVFALFWLIAGGIVGFVVGLACGFAASLIPAVWLTMVRKRRVEKISKQMPEAVILIANSLRAGFAFQHGINMVAEQMDAPIADEFARMTVDVNVGASIEEALQGLLERADSEDVNIMVTAVLIQRASGGNLSELLEMIGETMRERERLTGEVRTMTSQQRFSGTVLSIWPIFLLGLFSLLTWHTTKLLFTTSIGLVLLAIGGTLQLTGYYAIRRILDIEV